MGLEDLAMFRPVFNSIVLYPSDAVSTFRLVEEANNTEGIVYIRTTRPGTAVIYDNDEKFPIGGSKVMSAGDMCMGHLHILISFFSVTFTHTDCAKQPQ